MKKIYTICACGFTGKDQQELALHISYKHKKSGKCHCCIQDCPFVPRTSMLDFMIHSASKHAKSFPPHILTVPTN